MVQIKSHMHKTKMIICSSKNLEGVIKYEKYGMVVRIG